MSVLNPDHLLDQAVLLVNATPGRKPRQVNLRRAISTAYYAVFHLVLTAAADEFVTRRLRQDGRYALVYRGIDHGTIKRVCAEASRSMPTSKFEKFVPAAGFESSIRDFSVNFLQLQNRRHEADYDPSQQFTTADAINAISLARDGLDQFSVFTAEGKKLFLTLLLFPPR